MLILVMRKLGMWGGFANIDRVRASSLAEKPAHETDSPCLPAPRYHPAIIIFLLNIDPYRLEFIIKIETIIMSIKLKPSTKEYI